MNIPGKAYEAAVQALFEDGCGEPKVDASTAIEAAAPFIAAQALRNEAKNWTAGNIRALMLIAADEVEGAA